MKAIKALVIEHDLATRQAIDEILAVLGHKYDVATCLTEAREFMAVDGHKYVLLAHEIPLRVGGVPRALNTDRALDEFNSARGNRRPPVVVTFSPMPDVDEEDKIRWAADLRSQGATTFIRKPFRTRGRTLERVIGKLVAGQTETVRLVNSPVPQKEQEEPHASADVPTLGPAPAESKEPAPPPPPSAPATPAIEGRWASIPNEPVEIDEFMTRFCEKRTKETRMFRKRALLAAARNNTVALPPLANTRKSGQANKYFTHDLMAAWQGYIDAGVDLPALLSDGNNGRAPDSA